MAESECDIWTKQDLCFDFCRWIMLVEWVNRARWGEYLWFNHIALTLSRFRTSWMGQWSLPITSFMCLTS